MEYIIEIDFLDPDVIYKSEMVVFLDLTTVDPPTSIGNTFTNLFHSVTDIKLNPTNNLELFVATDEGLFKSTDRGDNFSTIMTGNFLRN